MIMASFCDTVAAKLARQVSCFIDHLEAFSNITEHADWSPRFSGVARRSSATFRGTLIIRLAFVLKSLRRLYFRNAEIRTKLVCWILNDFNCRNEHEGKMLIVTTIK